MKLSSFYFVLSLVLAAFPQLSYSFGINEKPKHTIVKTPADGGIREEIPKIHRAKYQKWKDEFLATEFGRRQWDKYSTNKQFILTIVISGEKGKGAKTDEFLWDEQGNIVGATITLGNKLDKGFPEPVYYPVMNSLSSDIDDYQIEGSILAAAKISHEIGHVNQLFEINKDLFRLQDELMPVYNKFFLKNGHNTRDQFLIGLAERMGGTPMKIWEDREYWGEVNAMQYLNERINKEIFYCDILNKIKRNVGLYAKDYKERFEQITTTPCGK